MNRDGTSRVWAAAMPAFAVTLLAAFLAYGQTVSSLVNVWSHSDTFVYGFFVAPACVYLVWRSRDSLATLRPRPYPLALIGLIPLGFAWLVGRAASTLLLEQVAFVAMIPVLVCAHFGPVVTRRLAFPLGFLFFAVPFGDFLQPKLMEVTADFAEQALRWSGLTVAREGFYLILPNSRWQVHESCSGLRFTVAGAVLATLFAHHTYRSNVKRAVFIASAIGVSIFANGVRAYVLILIGHLTQMRRGQGFDHYFYGWLVFTLLMSAWFLVGAAFRDREPEATPRNRSEPDPKPSSSLSKGRRASIAGLAVLALASWPAFDSLLSFRAGQGAVAAIAVASPAAAWTLEAVDSTVWHPLFHGATSESSGRYVTRDGSVQVHIAYYANQSQGRELLRERNRIADEEDPEWRIVREVDRRVTEGGPGFVARETVLRSHDTHEVVWHWYWLPDEYTTNPLRAKLLQARARLLGRRDHAAVVVLTASAFEPREAERLLAAFSADMLPSVHRSLRTVYDSP